MIDMRMPSSTRWLAHEHPRQGQIEMIDDALESLQEGKIFLAAAPTGIGKTAAALASCIDFASQDNFQSTIMFLTGKQSQHRIVIDTIRLINNRLPEEQRKILVVDLIGRDSMCKNLDRFQGICQCEGDGFSTPKNIDELRKFLNSGIYSLCVSWLSLPAGVVPTGLVNDLPAGVQIIGRRFREDLILNAMQVIEDQTGVLTKELWVRENMF